jgi:DNA-binding protein YbaB
MFDQFKKLAELKKMQDSFKKEKETVEKQGISATLNGNFEVEDIKLNSELGSDEQERLLKQCLNEARENIQKRLAKSLMASGLGSGFGL